MGAAYWAYHASAWGNFFFAAAGAAAALAGLIFVAVSMHLPHIVRHADLRVGAGVTLVWMLIAFVVSLEALVPGQSHSVLGAEIIVTLLLWVSPYMTTVMKLRRELGQLPELARRRAPYGYVAFMLMFIGGIGTLTHSMGGLFLVAPGVVTCMLIAVSNAWFFLTQVGAEEEVEEETVEKEIEEIAEAIRHDG